MSDIIPISRSQAALTAGRAGRAAAPSATVSPAARKSDSVEFSSTAQLLGKLHDLPDVRQDLVDRVKAQIAQGTYITDDKIDGAINGLLDDLKA